MDVNVVNQKILMLTEDKEFMQYLFEQDSYEKIQAAFASKDVELSIDEVKELVASVLAETEKTNAELDESELENVAGGIITVAAAVGLAKIAIVAGMSIAGGVIGWKIAGRR